MRKRVRAACKKKEKETPQRHQLRARVAAIPPERKAQRGRRGDRGHNAHVHALRLQLWPCTSTSGSRVDRKIPNIQDYFWASLGDNFEIAGRADQ